MYCEFYRLQMMPFENTPDPRFFFASEDHREALASIEYTIRMRKGMVLISGEIGSGKTTVSYALQHSVGDAAHVALIRQGLNTGRQLLKQICKAMALPVSGKSDRTEMIDAIEEALLEPHNAGKPVVLVIDEAQMHSTAVMHEIRMLSNLETPTRKLIQIVLIGQPEIRKMMEKPALDALRQRIVLCHHLQPMSQSDTGRYIEHRLNVAAAPGEPDVRFDEAAVDAIYQFTGGVPRLINVVADNCLLVSYVRSARWIDASIVQTVTENLVPGRPAHSTEAPAEDAGHLKLAEAA